MIWVSRQMAVNHNRKNKIKMMTQSLNFSIFLIRHTEERQQPAFTPTSSFICPSICSQTCGIQRLGAQSQPVRSRDARIFGSQTIKPQGVLAAMSHASQPLFINLTGPSFTQL